MLRDYILRCGEECQVVRNDEMSLEEIAQLNFDSIVISPGPHTSSEAGITMAIIDSYHLHKPILGVCLGHQAIGQYFGARLIQAQRPMHGKTSTIRHTAHPIFSGLSESVTVMRYHSLILDQIADTPLDVIAQTTEGEIMAICHRSLPLAGLQFHPESILTQGGLTMLQNWFSLIKP